MTEKHFISALEMAKKYDNVESLAQKFYIETLQPKMLEFAKGQKYYIATMLENNRGDWFYELDENPDKIEITSVVFDMLYELGYVRKKSPTISLISRPGVVMFDLTISWENQGDGIYDI